MAPIPYLIFPGTCRQAMTRYAEIFGGEVELIMPVSEAPDADDLPDEQSDWVLHISLRIDGGLLMGSDDFLGNAKSMAGALVMMDLPTVKQAQAAFRALSDGGMIEMPFGPNYWSPGFGTVTDRFGIRWIITVPQSDTPRT